MNHSKGEAETDANIFRPFAKQEKTGRRINPPPGLNLDYGGELIAAVRALEVSASFS
jgi:hypothetical protein